MKTYKKKVVPTMNFFKIQEIAKSSSRTIHYNNLVNYNINRLTDNNCLGTQAPWAFLGIKTHFVRSQHIAMMCSLKREKTAISSSKRVFFLQARLRFSFIRLPFLVSRLALMLSDLFNSLGRSLNKDTVEFCEKLQISIESHC